MSLELEMSKRAKFRRGAAAARVIDDRLEEAWYGAMDALPTGWLFTGVKLATTRTKARRVGMWYAHAWTDGAGACGTGYTPGAALRDLARYLRSLAEHDRA